MRFVGLLVTVWLIVGAIRGLSTRVFHQCRTELCQRWNDRGDRGRRAAQLRGCQSQSDGLSSAATQSITRTAQFEPI